MTLSGNFTAAQVSQVLDEICLWDTEWRKRFEAHLTKVRSADSERRIVDLDEVEKTITLRQVSEIMGVDYNTVMRWPQRRASNGFPEPTGRTLRGGLTRGRNPHGFDREQVRSWVLTTRGVDIG